MISESYLDILAPREKLPLASSVLGHTTRDHRKYHRNQKPRNRQSELSQPSDQDNVHASRIRPRMPTSLDKCKERPPHIETILTGLDRYNPETTTVFQDYVTLQCEEKFFDSYACLALLKL